MEGKALFTKGVCMEFVPCFSGLGKIHPKPWWQPFGTQLKVSQAAASYGLQISGTCLYGVQMACTSLLKLSEAGAREFTPKLLQPVNPAGTKPSIRI
jgi:hypothetical protein